MNVVEITQNKEIEPNAFLLEFNRFFEFIPGQIISISIKGHAPRLYSIASGKNENTIKILYDIKPDGQITPLLKDLKQGDKIEVSLPTGKFTSDPGPGYWIANGTGIAPFYSMFCSGLASGKTLIQGGRYKESFYFQDQFRNFFKENYVRCASQDQGEGLFHGRLTEFLKTRNQLPTDQKYYLCGSSEMVVEVRDILISKKVPFDHIIAEIYF